MSVWNQVLQAAHSALIDELNERFPADKLELGLPKRVEGAVGAESGARVLFREVKSNEGAGFLALSGNAKQNPHELADVLVKAVVRTEKEFKIRKIDASFGNPLASAPNARMTIWLPIVIRREPNDMTFDMALGLGI
ncbi:MAG: hypothetical protein JST04_15700 [Bdellovibrionales bacterium]|nr:hypothetical protein [Bdellovibrionales bacterium]